MKDHVLAGSRVLLHQPSTHAFSLHACQDLLSNLEPGFLVAEPAVPRSILGVGLDLTLDSFVSRVVTDRLGRLVEGFANLLHLPLLELNLGYRSHLLARGFDEFVFIDFV